MPRGFFRTQERLPLRAVDIVPVMSEKWGWSPWFDPGYYENEGKEMKREVIITCAVTGAGDTTGKNPAVPVTPEQIARAALQARKAGAAVAHIHVRDPKTGRTSREYGLYKEVVERIRNAGSDVIINLTAGMGGEFAPDENSPHLAAAGTDIVSARERIAHIRDLAPEMCTLDCGTMNLSRNAYIATPDQLRTMARGIREAGVRPEIEVFELGHIWMAKQLIKEGLVENPPIFQLCMGIPFGAPPCVECMLAMRNQLPQSAHWAAFGIGPYQFPFAAQSMLLGGNIRVGLEDNLYLEKGVLADNRQLVEKAVRLVDMLGGTVTTPDRAREILQLPQR